MERSNYHISLDIQDSHSSLLLNMKQHDTHRRIYIALTDGGRPYEIAGDCYGVFTGKKPDGTAIFNDCQIVGNTLVYDVTAQTTASVGELACEVRLYGTDDKLLTCAAFGISVCPAVVSDDDDIASMPEATTLARLLDRVEKVEDFIDDTTVSDKAWSAKHLVDTLCPPFCVTGNPVTCHPVALYPLTVEAEGEVTHCGKNLLGFADYSGVKSTNRTMSCADGVHSSSFTGAVSTSWIITDNVMENLTGKLLPPGKYVFSITQQSNGYTYKGCCGVVTLADGTTVELPDGESVTLTQWGTVTQFRCAATQGVTAGTLISFTLQIEAGDTPTGYEPYRGKTVEPGTVTALAGENTFFRDGGQITVTGRKDIISILEGMGNGD